MFPATTQASKDTPKEERRRVPSYDKSIQGHPRRKEGEERKERKKERKKEKQTNRQTDRQRGRERERREKEKAGVPSYEQSSRDTPKKERGDLEYSIQESPRKQRKKGGGKGEEGGLSARQVPMNLKLALAPMVTLCPAKVAGCFDRCGHVKA